MKKLLLWCCLSLLGLHVKAQTKVIDYPVEGKRSTDCVEFYRAEVSDTALILRGNLYNRPGHWVQLASLARLTGGVTGKVYRLVGAEGIEPDQKIYMPATWTCPFSLQFEPVEDKDRWVDFDEGTATNGEFVVREISLEEKKERKRIHCRIEGQVMGNPAYSRIMLYPEGTDDRVNDWQSIPVRDGRFSFDLYTDTEEPYELCAWSDKMTGAWRPVPFIAEDGVLKVTFYSLEKSAEVTSESPLNKELLAFNRQTDSLFMRSLRMEKDKLRREGKVESLEMQALHKQFEGAKDEAERKKLGDRAQELYRTGKAYTPEYYELEKKSTKAYDDFQAYSLDYIKADSSLVGLYLLKNQMERSKRQGKDLAPYIAVYREIYASLFSGNALTRYVRNWISALEVKVGNRFVDFEAPDLEGTRHLLSEEIAGKVALIDLWASWCGPCRRTSLSMIPVYESYKDKGFTVVGVARERSAGDMKAALVKDKYPWLNLLELDDRAKIWEKYGIGNAGGATFLVDKEGKILAVRPTAEEVKAILDKILWQN